MLNHAALMLRARKQATPLATEDLLPAERKVMEKLGRRPLDFRAMAAVSNLFRASMAVRRHMESRVLAADRLSWTSFVLLWVLWVWGKREVRELAVDVGVSRPTITGVVATLKRRHYVQSHRADSDARLVFVDLTPAGRRTIGRLFPRFNAQETTVAGCLSGQEQDTLARLLRMVLRGVDGENALAMPPQ